MSKYVQYGCGLSAPEQWTNYDASPTLRIQKMPVLGRLMRSRLNTVFPDNVVYGDIIKGLPEPANSCDGVYCSHTLEHLSLNDFRTALKNTLLIMKPGAVFRCVVPDLEALARAYVDGLNSGDRQASLRFVEGSLLGQKNRPRGLRGIASSVFGNSHHLWMWDTKSLGTELASAGFTSIRTCKFDDSKDPMFKFVESEDRFHNAAAIECFKPSS